MNQEAINNIISKFNQLNNKVGGSQNFIPTVDTKVQQYPQNQISELPQQIPISIPINPLQFSQYGQTPITIKQTLLPESLVHPSTHNQNIMTIQKFDKGVQVDKCIDDIQVQQETKSYKQSQVKKASRSSSTALTSNKTVQLQKTVDEQKQLIAQLRLDNERLQKQLRNAK